jgi:hypothetical protein
MFASMFVLQRATKTATAVLAQCSLALQATTIYKCAAYYVYSVYTYYICIYIYTRAVCLAILVSNKLCTQGHKPLLCKVNMTRYDTMKHAEALTLKGLTASRIALAVNV